MVKKKIISAALSVSIAAGCLGGTGLSADAAGVVASGTHGSNASWTLDSSGTLTIAGTGRLDDCVSSTTAHGPDVYKVNWYEGDAPPWYEIRAQIKTIVISEGITMLGQKMFVDCDNLTKIVFPDSLTHIGTECFIHCGGLVNVDFSENIETVGFGSFWSCTSIESIVFPENIVRIENNVLQDATSLKSVTVENPDCIINNNVGTTFCNSSDSALNAVYSGTINGYWGSTAYDYAEKFGYTFCDIGITLGDVIDDEVIDSSDASAVLTAYVSDSTGNGPGLTEEQIYAADVNTDGVVDASDASVILSYYAYTATGGTGSIEEFLK